MAKRVVVSVISDLATDQRVHKVCQTLRQSGYEVHLIGSKKKHSLALDKRIYSTSRIAMIFQKKFLFYAEFNTRLFFRLLFHKADILLGNDLDVMPATWLAAALKRKPLVYDTHEYFMAMAGLDNKPMVRRVWKAVESFIFPKLRYIYTICDSFCELYEKDYQKKLLAVRNVPYLHSSEEEGHEDLLKAIDAQIPRNKFLLLFQGAGINPHRGAEELVLTMQWLDPLKFHLLIVGGGDSFPQVLALIEQHGLRDRITTIPKQPFSLLKHITRQADLGLSLDKADNINHKYGLPNKIFDYLHAGVPVLVSRLIELEKIVNAYNVGDFIENHDPAHIASCIQKVADNPGKLKIWKDNTENLRRDLNWENEGKIVLRIFKQVESETVK
jgi:glycosyltransferase involved in cell wall biosynthesis